MVNHNCWFNLASSAHKHQANSPFRNQSSTFSTVFFFWNNGVVDFNRAKIKKQDRSPALALDKPEPKAVSDGEVSGTSIQTAIMTTICVSHSFLYHLLQSNKN